MADKKPPNPNFVVLNLKKSPTGTEIRLVKDFNHICTAEEISGCNLMKAMVGTGNISSRDTRALFYACSLEWNPTVTLEECGDLLGGDELGTILEALGKTLGMDDAEPPPPPPSIEDLPVAVTT